MTPLCLCIHHRFDESLWHSVDLEGMTHTALALQQVLRTGIRRLRCPRSFVEELHLTGRGLVTYIVVCPDFLLQWKTYSEFSLPAKSE